MYFFYFSSYIYIKGPKKGRVLLVPMDPSLIVNINNILIPSTLLTVQIMKKYKKKFINDNFTYLNFFSFNQCPNTILICISLIHPITYFIEIINTSNNIHTWY